MVSVLIGAITSRLVTGLGGSSLTRITFPFFISNTVAFVPLFGEDT
jgi:hypothetical protein